MSSVSSIRFRPRSTPVNSPAGQKRLFLAEDGLLKTIDDAGNVSEVGGSGGSAGSDSYTLKTADFTAEIGKSYALDTTDGPINVTLPPSPVDGKEVCFVDARGTWNTHPPTFLRNGSKIEGHEIDFVDSAQGTFFCALFIDATTGWRILESGTKPQILVAPEIPGGAIGVLMEATTGTWTGTPTSFAYQWQVSDDGVAWTNLEGATSSTFTPDSSLEGKYVRVLVTASNSNGASLPAESNTSDQLSTPAFPAGAVAFWKLGDLTDASGNGHALTNNNGAGFISGKIGDCADFDGTNYLSAATNLLSGASALTISAWVKVTGAGVFVVSSDSSSSAVLLATTGFCVSASWNPALNTATVNDGGWHHFLGRFEGATGELSLWVDGVEGVVNNTGPSEVASSEITTTNIGANGGGDYSLMVGQIDAVGIWHRALSNAEIAQLYNSGTGAEPA